MPQAKVNKEYRTFVKGLVTEASPLTFPEEASLDEANFILNRNGSRSRRLGLDYENGYALTDSTIAYSTTNTRSISTHEWKNVGENSESIFSAVQFGDMLYFFNTTSPISANYLGSVQLTKRSGGTSGNERITTASGLGVLVVCGADFEPQYIDYDSTRTPLFKSNPINIKIRDFDGVDDEYEVDEHPTSLTNKHKYNLLNQGWPEDRITLYNTSAKTGTPGDIWPSNAEVHFFGTWVDVTSGLKKWGITQILPGTYSGVYYAGTDFGTTPAPKGRYIIDAFSRSSSRMTESGVTGLATDVEIGRPIATTYFNGRIFYGGTRSNVTGDETNQPDYNGFVFFSPILDNISSLGKCYQEADPTSEHINQLLPTDGGVINIPEMNKLLAMITLSKSIVCIAENGVWEIEGGSSGFAADDFFIRKVSDRGAVNAGSIIQAEDSIAYWNESGIYTTSVNDVSGNLAVSNITQDTIHTYYADISATAKSQAVGIFDAGGRKLRWLYSSDSSYNGSNYKNKYDTELILDITLQAFYPHKISSLGETVDPFVAGYINTPIYGSSAEFIAVTDDAVAVTDGAVAVTDASTVISGNASSVKFLTLSTTNNAASGNWYIGISEYNNVTFYDWVTASGSTGVDYTSYLITGYELLDDTARIKQGGYLTTHFNRTETGFTDDGSGNLSAVRPSSCNISTRWDFSDSTASGKWGTAFEAYRLRRLYLPSSAVDTFDYGQKVVTTKNKVRGSGRALSLYFYSTPGKDLQLLGWNTTFQARTGV